MEEFDVIPMFSSPLFSVIVNEDTDELKESNSKFIASTLQGLDNLENTTFTILDEHPRVKNILLSYWKKVNKEFLFNDCEHIISTSWITKIERGQFSQVHWHKNSYYSAVYYYDDYDDECADLIMLNPLDKFTDFYTPSSDQNNIFTSAVWGAKPKKNKLLFFPSYISHSVGQHRSNSSRYSLAFNICPIGEYGNGDSYMDTRWYNQSTRIKEEKLGSTSEWSFDMLSETKKSNSMYPGDDQ